jgi:hypothetical protein
MQREEHRSFERTASSLAMYQSIRIPLSHRAAMSLSLRRGSRGLVTAISSLIPPSNDLQANSRTSLGIAISSAQTRPQSSFTPDKEAIMALKFLGKDPDSPVNDSPTIYDNGDTYVIQGCCAMRRSVVFPV